MTEKQEKTKDKLTLIVFSGDIDKVHAAFTLATSAASMDQGVTMFFTFWGLNAIKKNPPRIKGKGFMQKALNFVNRGGAKRLPMSKLNMVGAGPAMLKKMMKTNKIPTIDEFIKMASKLGVKMVGCEQSMSVMGIQKEDLVEEVSEVVGAVSYLGEAKDGNVNLFIS
ncbi:MAG: hypothetical protein E3J54_06225 [Actinobacteria bacterium]|nr:MAG: hypothetical protein E3J54_06225 [Actinomycetota bacterium]